MKIAERTFWGEKGKALDVMDVERGMEQSAGHSASLQYLISYFCTA